MQLAGMHTDEGGDRHGRSNTRAVIRRDGAGGVQLDSNGRMSSDGDATKTLRVTRVL